MCYSCCSQRKDVGCNERQLRYPQNLQTILGYHSNEHFPNNNIEKGLWSKYLTSVYYYCQESANTAQSSATEENSTDTRKPQISSRSSWTRRSASTALYYTVGNAYIT